MVLHAPHFPPLHVSPAFSATRIIMVPVCVLKLFLSMTVHTNTLVLMNNFLLIFIWYSSGNLVVCLDSCAF